jgi:GTP-binding protein
LELYSLDLAQKPEIVVVSKAELPGSETVREELQAALGREVLAMSAVTGQGMSRLVGAVVRALAELPAGAPV